MDYTSNRLFRERIRKFNYYKEQMNKSVYVDITHPDIFGDKLFYLQYFTALQNAFSEVCIHIENFKEKLEEGRKVRTIAPNKLIYDILENLIKPTFGVKILSESIGIKDFKLNRHFDYAIKLDRTVNHDLQSHSFKWKIFPLLICEKKHIDLEFELMKTKNIILYATYDPQGINEVNKGRICGSHVVNFSLFLDKIKELDEYCMNGKHRIILMSKKAQGFRKILKSNYLDWTMPEEKGLKQSQALYLATKYSNFSIGQYTTMGQLITCCKNVNHLVWDQYEMNKATKVFANMPYFVNRVSIWDMMGLDKGLFKTILSRG